MAYNPVNPNGQATSANSSPVVVASDQSAVPVAATVITLAIGSITATISNTINALATVTQGTTPWLVNASVVGQQAVTATYASPWNVTATVGNTVTANVASIVTLAIGSMPAISVTATNTTVFQGGAPWLVNASVVGNLQVTATAATLSVGSQNATVYQGGAPWLVNASVVGQQAVTATYASPWNVTATVGNTVTANVASIVTLAIGSMPAISVTATNTTVFQGGAPWLVNASVVGQLAVTATVAAPLPVTATIGGGFVALRADTGTTGTNEYYNAAILNTVATVKAGPAMTYGWYAYNPNATVAYFAIYSQTLATIGITPPTKVLPIPPTSALNIQHGAAPASHNPALIIAAGVSLNVTGKLTTGLVTTIWYL